MSNALYGKARQRFLSGTLAWSPDVALKVVLVDLDDYTVSIDGHEFLSDIPAAARVATSAALTSKTAVLGVADADDVSIPAVVGDQCEALVIYRDTGSAATSPLIAFIDTATGLPATPNGGSVNITWSDAANRIFKL